MNQLISQNSTSKGNLRFRKMLKDNPALLDEISDARIFNEIANQLYMLRRHSGFTQKELAEKIQLKQSNISRWEKAGYQGYKIKVLSKLARTLGGNLEVSLIPKQNIYNIEYKIERQTYHLDGVIETNTRSLVIPINGSASQLNSQFKKGEEYVREFN